MKKLKVVQLIDTLNVGGAEVLAVNINNLLFEDSEFESFFCVTREEGELKKRIHDKNSYLFLNKKHPLDFKALFKLKKFIKHHKIDIIHAHTNSYFTAVLLKIIFVNIDIVWHNHTGNFTNLKGKRLWVLKICSLFIKTIINVNSDLNIWAKNTLYAKRTLYIKNFPAFSITKKTTKLKGLNNKRIVIVAGIRRVKNHLNLLKAYKQVYDKGFDWTLHIVGELSEEKEYFQEIISFIKLHKLNKNVFLYHGCFDIENILKQSSIGVLSSDAEGLPIALLEYGLIGLPVVVTKVGQCNVLVEDCFSGFVVEANNPDKFSRALVKLMENSKIRIDFGDNLKYKVLNEYSKENFVMELKSIYKSL